MVCYRCYKKLYDERKRQIRGQVRKRQKLDGIEKKCVICTCTKTRIAGTPRTPPGYPRWFCYNGGAICYRCKLRLLSWQRARKRGIPIRNFHDNRPLVNLIRKCPQYLNWRMEILKRDNFRCMHCGDSPTHLQAHHIKPFLDILKENNIDSFEKAMKCEVLWNLDNGITMCRPCHQKRPLELVILARHYKK
jgi:5-methylcytosine-specific restriction endonuclease McrA